MFYKPPVCISTRMLGAIAAAALLGAPLAIG